MFDFVAVSALVGSFLPLVISLFKSWNSGTQTKRVLAVVLSAVAAVVTVGATNGWSELDFATTATWATVVTSFGLVYALAQTTYKGFWQDTRVESALSAVGNSTAESTEG